LFVWVERKLNRVVRAHELGVSCIWSSPCGAITGSKDGVIKQWSLDLEHMHTFSLSDADIPPVLSCLRSIDASLTLEDDAIARILATTAGGEIYEIAARSGSTSLVHEAHNSGELWGLCTHPTDPDVFVTCGDDKTVRVWSISHRRLLRKAVLDCTARSVAWSHDGKHIILGLGGSWDGKRQRKDGAFILLEAATLRPIFEGRYVRSIDR
jgi:WD40 repeat protein